MEKLTVKNTDGCFEKDVYSEEENVKSRDGMKDLRLVFISIADVCLSLFQHNCHKSKGYLNISAEDGGIQIFIE